MSEADAAYQQGYDRGYQLGQTTRVAEVERLLKDREELCDTYLADFEAERAKVIELEAREKATAKEAYEFMRDWYPSRTSEDGPPPFKVWWSSRKEKVDK